jgi:hypothetical protein
MGYDLMVFNKAAAPGTKAEFMQWYDQQTEWREGHSYDDPAVSTKELRDWFLDMIKKFPALNGPHAFHDGTSYVTDYCIGQNVIYAGFAFSLAGEAYKLVYELAEKHQVGFFDVSGTEDIFIPVNGKLEAIKKHNKRWWKFWTS